MRFVMSLFLFLPVIAFSCPDNYFYYVATKKICLKTDPGSGLLKINYGITITPNVLKQFTVINGEYWEVSTSGPNAVDANLLKKFPGYFNFMVPGMRDENKNLLYLTNEILIRFDNSLSEAAQEKLLQDYGLSLARRSKSGSVVASFPESKMTNLALLEKIQALVEKEKGKIDYAEPNSLVSLKAE